MNNESTNQDSRFVLPETVDDLTDPRIAWPSAGHEAEERAADALDGFPAGAVRTAEDAYGDRERIVRDFMYALGIGVATARAEGRDLDDKNVAAEIVLDARKWADDMAARTIRSQASWTADRITTAQPTPDDLFAWFEPEGLRVTTAEAAV